MTTVAELLRAELITQLKWAGPLVTEQVLLHVATVPYRGDDNSYIKEATAVAFEAAAVALQPTFDAMAAEAAAFRAQADAADARAERVRRVFEAFLNTDTPKWIQ